MGKIICEMCGSSYSDSEEVCPVCGYARDPDSEPEQNELQTESPDDAPGFDAGQPVPDSAPEEAPVSDMPPMDGPMAPPEHGMFDFDAVNRQDVSEESDEAFSSDDYEQLLQEAPPQDDGYRSFEDLGEEEDDLGGMEEYDDPLGGPKKQPVGLIIFLVVLNVLLLSATAFLFFRFLLPGKLADQVPPTTAVFETEAPTTAETTVPAVPCTSLSLTSAGNVELNREGQYWLIHAKAIPEDTTDQILYFTEDETVATVSESGRVTAVGEGKTNIIVTCGLQQISCPITVVYKDVTVPDETMPMLTRPAEETEASETKETQAAETKPAETEPAETRPAETKPAETEPAETKPAETKPKKPVDPDIVLKLKDKDILFPRIGLSKTLLLDCELEQEDVEWSSSDPSIVTVDEGGVVKTMSYGNATITAKYGDQEVSCIVRCHKK